MIKIAVTEKEFNKAKNIFETSSKNGLICLKCPSNENELSAFITEHQIRHVIIGVEPYHSSLYTALMPGAVIARFGVGVDNINQKLAQEKGIYCTNTPDALVDCVAEYALALILSAARNISKMNTNFINGSWRPQMGFELSGKTLAVIGTGKIGTRLAQIAKNGFRMNVIGVKNPANKNNNPMMSETYSLIAENFEEAVKDADFISLHLPHNPETHHYLNNKSMALIPAKAWVINTARGGLINERSLFEALSSKKLSGACLDVFESEPYAPVSPNHDLRKLENVILTPHAGSTTTEACQKMATICLKNILLLEKGFVSEMNTLNK